MTQQFLTINDLIARLKAYRPDNQVRFEFCDSIPTRINSSRGYYDRPALGWSPSGYSFRPVGKEPYPTCTVESLIHELDEAISGKMFCGWKGGEYHYSGDDPLYVDNDGDWTATRIVSVKLIDTRVTLITVKEQSE